MTNAKDKPAAAAIKDLLSQGPAQDLLIMPTYNQDQILRGPRMDLVRVSRPLWGGRHEYAGRA